MMDVGRRSLANSQTALQTTAHNIANKSTEGYSRQRVDFVTNEPVGEGRLRIGMGARAGQVNRTNNPFLEKQIEREGNQLGFLNSRSELLGRVEQVYNEQTNEGLNHSMGKFFNSFRELSNNPESLASRTAVKESAEGLTKDFQHVNQQLTDIQKDADFRIVTKVEEINQLSREIANLNEKISAVELTGAPANDERDRRDLLVKQLGDKVNIRYAESPSGQLTITAGNTAVLVSGFSYREIKAVSTPEAERQAENGVDRSLASAANGKAQKREGNFDIVYKSTEYSTPVTITQQLKGGEIGGLLQVRDNVINKFIGDMDNLAHSLATEVNRTHMAGYDRYGNAGGAVFDIGSDPKGAAANFKLNEDLANDVGRLAAAAEPGAPGDNRIANILSKLEYKQAMDGGTATYNDYYSSLVGKIGIETQRATSAQQSQGDIVSQLKNIRESISGVSLDEETTKMIEFQKSFDASARLVRTADEMMDTVLNLKRL